jgi:hypothetical protein
MAYEDFLASQRWTNLPPPNIGPFPPKSIGLLSPEVNRYQQIMAQMAGGATDNYVVPTTTGGYNPAIYDVTPEQNQAATKLNEALSKFGGGSSTAAAQQAALTAAMEGLTPGEVAAIDAMAIPNLVNLLMPLPIQILMNVLGIDAPGVTSSGGVSATSGSPMGGIASKGTKGQVANATTTVGQAIGNAIGAGVGGTSSSPGSVGGGMAGMGSGHAGVAATAAATGSGMGGGGGSSGGGGGGGNGSGGSSAGGSSAGSAYSDMRMKDHIVPIGNAINKVRKLDGVTFNMDGKRGTGLVAQQVEKVLPEVVHKDANGMRMVDYGNIVGLLVEAIKEMDGKKSKKTKGLLEA